MTTRLLLSMLALMLLIFCTHAQKPKAVDFGESDNFIFDTSDTLITVYIELDADEFNQIYRSFRQDIWIRAEIILQSENRVVVRLRIRGDSSRKLSKKSLKLKLPSDVRLLSNSRMLNLNAEFSDLTFMRQYLATKLFQESGHTCFSSKHILLHINGTFDGIYLWIENMDNAFLQKRGFNSKNLLYKATRDGANLSLSDDIERNWECKNGSEEVACAALKKLQIDLNNTPDSLYYNWVRKTFDYDAMINILSMNMLISNSSTYYHNYYMFYDIHSQKWQMWPWDMDKTFCYDKIDMHYHRGSHRERRSASLPGNPIMERAIICEPIFNDIQKRTNELQKTIFNIQYVTPTIDSLEKKLIEYVKRDTKRSQSIESFQKEVNRLREFFILRYDNLKYQFDHYPRSFAIHRPKKSFKEDVKLTWEPSFDPDGDSLVYNVYFCADPKFKENVTTINNLKSTQCTIEHSSIEKGRYYFKVSVSDGKHKIYGYDSCHSFKVD